jgi:hypothetical protein
LDSALVEVDDENDYHKDGDFDDDDEDDEDEEEEEEEDDFSNTCRWLSHVWGVHPEDQVQALKVNSAV